MRVVQPHFHLQQVFADGAFQVAQGVGPGYAHGFWKRPLLPQCSRCPTRGAGIGHQERQGMVQSEGAHQVLELHFAQLIGRGGVGQLVPSAA